MNYIVFKDIDIFYSDKCEADAIAFLNILKNNYFSTMDYLQLLNPNIKILCFAKNDPFNNRDDVLLVDNKDEFINCFLDAHTDKQLAAAYEKMDLKSYYLEFIIRKYDLVNSFFKISNDSNEKFFELYDYLVAYYYFKNNGSIEEYKEFLKYRTNIETIYNWVVEKVRYDAYNYLLSLYYEYYKSDEKFIEELPLIMDIVNGNTVSCKVNSENLPKLSREELHQLFYEFLNYINAPISWKNAYDYLRDNNLIEFKKSGDESCYYVDDKGKEKICISADENIDSFRLFVHEFVHYVSHYNCESPSLHVLDEVPSIYFETIAAIFLAKKGYGNDFFDYVIDYRDNSNRQTYLCHTFVFNDLIKYMTRGPITCEEKNLTYSLAFTKLGESKFKDFASSNAELSNKMVDIFTLRALNISSDVIIKGLGCSYIIGAYLRDITLDILDMDDGLDKMIYLTEHLKDFDLEDTLKYFGISIEPKSSNYSDLNTLK